MKLLNKWPLLLGAVFVVASCREAPVTSGPTGPSFELLSGFTTGKMYWTDASTRKIQRANLDGSGVEDLITMELIAPKGIALDVAGGKMYWVESSKIRRANLDGSGVEVLVGSVGPVAIALDVAGGKMYWTDVFITGKIQRANLDGTGVEDLVTFVGDREGLALDVAGGKMYWTNRGSDRIRRANLDGSGVEDLITTGLIDPRGIALDVAGGKMYWVEAGTDKIQRANLDGTGVEDLITTGLVTPVGIALDVAGGKMYWTDFGTDKIQRANLDGTGVEDLITTGLVTPVGISLELEPTTVPAGTGCVAANFGLPLGTFGAASAKFAILANTGAAARSIVSVDLFMRASSSPHTVAVSIWSRSGRQNLGPASQLGGGTVNVGLTAAVYTTNISPTVGLPAATDFFIVIDNPSDGGVLILPISTSGTIVIQYNTVHRKWNGPFSSVPWSYSVNCQVTPDVDVDIKPGSDPNSMDPDAVDAVIPVAILTTETFDATTVDHTTVEFGPFGATEIHEKDGPIVTRHEQDVDGDGDTDLLLHFRFGDTGLVCGDTKATLTGTTFDGKSIEGTDAIRTVGCS